MINIEMMVLCYRIYFTWNLPFKLILYGERIENPNVGVTAGNCRQIKKYSRNNLSPEEKNICFTPCRFRPIKGITPSLT